MSMKETPVCFILHCKVQSYFQLSILNGHRILDIYVSLKIEQSDHQTRD